MFAQPQDGLVPLGGNFYATPNESQEPNYRNPFVFPIYFNLQERELEINPPVGIQRRIILDNCNIGIEVNAFLAYVRLPNFQLLYRHPNCTPPFEPPPQKTPKYRIPDSDGKCPLRDGFGNFSDGYRRLCRIGGNVLENKGDLNIILVSSNKQVDRYYNTATGEMKGERITEHTQNITSVQYPVIEMINGVEIKSAIITFEGTHNYREYWKEVFYEGNPGVPGIHSPGGRKPEDLFVSSEKRYGTITVRPVNPLNTTNSFNWGRVREYNPRNLTAEIKKSHLIDGIQQLDSSEQSYTIDIGDSYSTVFIGRGSYNDMAARYYDMLGESEGWIDWNDDISLRDITTVISDTYFPSYSTEIKYITECFSFGEPVFSPPPPPPKPKKPMKCCPQDDRLLRLILKRIGSLPATVPNSLLTENAVQPQFSKKINSLTEYMTWSYERLDELMGEWESSVKIKGGKNDKGQDVETIVRLPNLAEAVSEIFALTMQNYTRVDTILNIVTRILLESAAIKQQDFKSYKAIMAMVDWMNFDHKDEVLEMPLTCDPSKGSNFNNLLKESDVKVSVMNATDKHTLNETLHNLMFAASIIKGTFLKKTGDELSDIFPNVKDGLDKLSGNIDKDEVQKFVNELLKKNDT